MRAERRLGELIRAQKESVGLARGGKPYQATGAAKGPVAPTLADAGIDKKLSSRAQKLAAVPEERFEGMLGEVVKGEFAENYQRKDFTPTEMVAIGEALEPLERQAAEQRMTLGKVTTGSEPGKTRDKVAAFVGVSGRTYEKAPEPAPEPRLWASRARAGLGHPSSARGLAAAYSRRLGHNPDLGARPG